MKTKVKTSPQPSQADQHNSKTFIHFGLKKGILNRISSSNKMKELILQFNIDGLPLWRSSRTEFWPILCRITNAKDCSEFMVSLPCGVGKPKNLISFPTTISFHFNNGATFRQAEKKFKIPRQTICNGVHEKHSQSVGRPSALSDNEEKAIVSGILCVAEWGFPINRFEIRIIIRDFLNSK